MTPLAEAAARLGLPVFPCLGNGAPLTTRGFYDATTDPEIISRFFRSERAIRVGIPTGEASGWDALDIDPRNGGDIWEQAHLHHLPETRIHQTPRGGRHYIFRHVHGVTCSAGKIAPGVDVRGTGGYICAPPSPKYSVINDVEPAEWPDWLLELVVRIPEEKPRPVYTTPPQPASTKRIEGLVGSVLRKVSQAAEGQKHFTLRNHALYLGGIAHLTGLSDADLVRRLMDALPATVRDHRNAQKTAEWGLKEGRAKPMDLPPDRPDWKPNGTKPYTNGHAHHVPSAEEQPEQGQTEPDNQPLPLPVVFFDEIKPTLDAADFVENVLIHNQMSVIYGQSNSGKTFWTADLALHVAAGKAWRGHQVERGGVLWLAMEGSFGIFNRVMAWREYHDIDASSLPFAIVPVSLNLLDPQADTEKLILTINRIKDRLEIPVRWTIVDTLSRAMAGGNENAPDDMGALVTNGTRIQQEARSALSWIHHSGKDEAKGARGHSLLRAATDTEIEITANNGSRLARVTKQREMECVGSFPFTLKIIELGKNRRNKPVTSCVVEPAEDGDTASAVLSKGFSGHARRALDVLNDLLADSGKSGFEGTPAGMISVPEDWWRKRFYDRTGDDGKEDITQDGKRVAFNRARDQLVSRRAVGLNKGRVWIAYQRPDTQTSDQTDDQT